MASKKRPKNAKKVDTAKPKRPKAKGLRLDHVRDVTERVLATDPLPPALPNIAMSRTVMSSLLNPGLTTDQIAKKEAGEQAQKLIQAGGPVAQAIHAMIAMRRGYAVAYRAYQEMMELLAAKAEEKGDPHHPHLQDFLVQYAMYQATKPFSEHTFMKSMLELALPFFTDVIDAHTDAESKQRQEDIEDREKLRVAREIPVGFTHSVHQENATVDKKKTLTLVGWVNALLWLVDQVVLPTLAKSGETEEAGPFTVIRMADRATPKDQSKDVVYLGGNAWKNCCDTPRKLALCMGEHVADRLSGQPDLVIVDDLPKAYGLGLFGRPPAASAGDAHKTLRKWCDRAAAGILGLVPCDSRELPDVTAPEWEQLKTFTHLRTVQVLSEGEGLDPAKYRIVVGGDASVFEVDRTVLDGYSGQTILVPAGVNVQT